MVSIIPHTHEVTTFNRLQQGDRVNVEFDMIGKYILSKSA
jgi:riboflavin synthase